VRAPDRLTPALPRHAVEEHLDSCRSCLPCDPAAQRVARRSAAMAVAWVKRTVARLPRLEPVGLEE
jgi:hypothetical protein